MEKGIEAMTKRATNIMEQIAEDIARLILAPAPQAEKEKAWGKISDKYQKFAKPNNLNPYDLDQFKEYVIKQKWNEFKKKLMEWASEQTNAIEQDGPLENLSEDDVLIAIKHIHTLVVANLLIEFLHFNGVID